MKISATDKYDARMFPLWHYIDWSGYVYGEDGLYSSASMDYRLIDSPEEGFDYIGNWLPHVLLTDAACLEAVGCLDSGLL